MLSGCFGNAGATPLRNKRHFERKPGLAWRIWNAVTKSRLSTWRVASTDLLPRVSGRAESSAEFIFAVFRASLANG
jgi:hypothetical protein